MRVENDWTDYGALFAGCSILGGGLVLLVVVLVKAFA